MGDTLQNVTGYAVIKAQFLLSRGKKLLMVNIIEEYKILSAIDQGNSEYSSK